MYMGGAPVVILGHAGKNLQLPDLGLAE